MIISKENDLDSEHKKLLIECVNFYQKNNFKQAKQNLLRIFKKYPYNVEADQTMGRILFQQGYFDEALSCLKRALKNAKANVKKEILFNDLGYIYLSLGQLKKAAESFKQSIKNNPKYIIAYYNKANTYLALGSPELSLKILKQALNIDKNNTQTHSNIAGIYELLNENEKEKASVEKALSLDPKNLLANCQYATILRKEKKNRQAIKLLEQLLIDKSANLNFSRIYYELGYLYDRDNNAQKAMHYFVKANDLESKTPAAKRCNKFKYKDKIQLFLRSFNKKDVGLWTKYSRKDEYTDPTFIVGFPRSGTTLLDKILGSHPQIQTIEEKPCLQEIEIKIEKKSSDYFQTLSSLSETDIYELRKDYFKSINKYINLKKGKVFIDKYPLHIVSVGTIMRIFPNAKFIFSLRHPCDACLSCFMQSFKLNDAMVNFLSFEDTLDLYKQVMEMWLKYNKIFDLNAHEIKYEKLIDNFDGEINSLLHFIGVKWNKSVLNYVEYAKSKRITTPSYSQVTEPIYKRAKFRWLKYKDFFDKYLNTNFKFYINQFGYKK